MTQFKLSTLILGVCLILNACAPSGTTETEIDPEAVLTTAEAIDAASNDDWRDLDPANTLYMEMETGRIIIELAPQFAPQHVENIKTLVSENYFDNLWVIRSHDNYVAQWGDADAENPKSLGSARTNINPEWERDWPETLPVSILKDGDVYQDQAGYAYGFPVAGNQSKNKIGMAHCYGMVGVSRGNEIDSGNGSGLYAVTGHSPRHLDRNVTLVGRIWLGIEHLSSLPRGTESLGFYTTPEEYSPVKSIRLAADLPESERTHLQIMRTDTKVFKDYLDARRYRKEDWFVDPAGRLSLCNVPMPTRMRP